MVSSNIYTAGTDEFALTVLKLEGRIVWHRKFADHTMKEQITVRAVIDTNQHNPV